MFVAFAIILATPLAFPFTKDVAAERHWVFVSIYLIFLEVIARNSLKVSVSGGPVSNHKARGA